MNPAIQNAIRILGQGFTRSPGAWGALDPGSLYGAYKQDPLSAAMGVAMMGSVKPIRTLTPEQVSTVFDVANQAKSGMVKFDPVKSSFVRNQLKTVFDIAEKELPEHAKQGKLTLEAAIKVARELAKKSALGRYKGR